jgi:TRAP-type C4-dicarboxylate transport system permease small subunit
LRTSIFADAVPAVMRRILRTFCMLLGLAVFLGLVWSTWPSFIEAYHIGEYEGEGALRIATWPVRGIVLIMSAFAMFAYFSMIYYDWRGGLIDELQAPGSSSEPVSV